MKILQLAPVWETVPPPAYGGTETVVSALTDELVRRGHEVTLWASGDSTSSADLRAVVPSSLRQAGLCDDALQYSLVHVAMALKEADVAGYDIVHNHNGPPNEIAMAMSHLIRTPMLTTLHNLLVEESRFIWSRYTGWYNTISQQQADSMPVMPCAGFAGVVYNAIDVDSFPYEEQKQDYLLFLGRMAPVKAPHLAIEAARRAGTRIVLAGKVSMPDEKEYFDQVLRPLIDGHNVEFIGEADAAMKRELFKNARALLLPLQWDEPFGLVMIEAMACGTPAIVFDRGAAPEIVSDGENGYLVHDVDGMVHALDRLDAIDPRACRATVEEKFSPRALADNYLATYQRILDLEEAPL
jgi:glycosyltransferase involved in cell wall biosynthesis